MTKSPTYKSGGVGDSCPERLAIQQLWSQDTDQRFGLKTKRRKVYWRWAVKKPMRQEDYFHSFLPTQDHTESREKDGVRWLVWHPYNISLFDLTLLDTKCKEHGLHFEVHPWSWYYPGATFMVAVRARRDNDL